jgi:hypothetical protein
LPILLRGYLIDRSFTILLVHFGRKVVVHIGGSCANSVK